MQSYLNIISFSVFERYRPYIDDWSNFCQTLAQPLPTWVWANNLRLSPQELQQIFHEDRIEHEPLNWPIGAFKLPPEFRPSRHWAYLAGLYQVQELVSMIPVALLAPQPGERILDLCAAPGNKTAQIAVQLNNQGTVVANDVSIGRMRAVRQVLERLGLFNVATTVMNGANYPKKSGLFDHVLVDAPCSCEGTSRKQPRIINRIGVKVSLRKQGLQKALLTRAVQLCKPGGRIVYSTCTYAPEENEMVIEAVLNQIGLDRLQVISVHGIDSRFKTKPGFTHWQSQTFHPSIKNCIRIWPHDNNTGGFFVAVLEKSNPVSAGKKPKPIELYSFTKPQQLNNRLSLLTERFGISLEQLNSYQLFQPKRDRFYLTNLANQAPVCPKPDAVGLGFLNLGMKYPKLTTAGALLLGNHVTKNFIELSSSQTNQYLTRQDVLVSANQVTHCTGRGYVVVRYQGRALGVGLYDPTNKVVQSMFPKGWVYQ